MTRSDASEPDDLIAYGLMTADAFASLRHVAANIAGALLLVATARRVSMQAHAMLREAEALYARATDVIAAAKVPSRAAHQHHHVQKAAASLGAALKSCNPGGVGLPDVDAALPSMSEGWRQLGFAAAALPGVEIVSLDRACCREHARVLQISVEAPINRA